ncbi:hypothetical protein [Chondrinema litorale]|uniref:hypothetical protein n=1 Tax=Chondrinema litorale TaxID=2994555 RepID=UPI002543EF83|nr:hypothetical protein [Chondrinema litorale]UZR97522.1 hypothetical protein OQ292_27325 [Chondrinema litorale]
MKRLKLSKRMWWKHYGGLLILGIIITPYTISLLYIDAIEFTMDSFWYFFLLILFFGMWWNQYNILYFKVLDTKLNSTDSYTALIGAINSLKWEIRLEEQNKIEAINSAANDVRTSGNEMITILFEGSKIYINSVCNLDRGSKPQMLFSFGKNAENVGNLIDFYQENEAYILSLKEEYK